MATADIQVTVKSPTRVLIAVVAFTSPTVLFYFALFAAYGFNPDFLDIGRCLDRGGRWNNERRACESAFDLDPEGASRVRLARVRRGEDWGPLNDPSSSDHSSSVGSAGGGPVGTGAFFPLRQPGVIAEYVQGLAHLGLSHADATARSL